MYCNAFLFRAGPPLDIAWSRKSCAPLASGPDLRSDFVAFTRSRRRSSRNNDAVVACDDAVAAVLLAAAAAAASAAAAAVRVLDVPRVVCCCVLY